MKKLLSIAVFAFGLSASIAHAQEPKANSQNAIEVQALESQTHSDQSHYSAEQSTAKKSLLTKAFAFGGGVQARIENAKENVKSSLSGELKDKFTSAKHAWDAGKAEWQSANAKHDSKSVNVSSDTKVDGRFRTSSY